MKTLVEYIQCYHIDNYINEAIKSLGENRKGIVVFDIDDTLLKTDASIFKVYKNKPGEPQQIMTTKQFAKDPDSKDHIEWFDYHEMRDPEKIKQAIVKGTPLLRNLKIMDAHIRAGYEFCFLTARACEDVIKDALDEFLLTRDKNGNLVGMGAAFNKTMSHAINDITKNYPGSSISEKKANVLKDLCKRYDKVIFVDDDQKNVDQAKGLGLKNLTVIKAWED